MLVTPCVVLGWPECTPAWSNVIAWDKCCCAACQLSRRVICPQKELPDQRGGDVTWYAFYRLSSGFMRQKIKQQISSVTSCKVLLSHRQHVSLETAFQEGGLVSSFYLFPLTHGVACTRCICLHCGTAGQKQQQVKGRDPLELVVLLVRS